jgi:hypothetical protein
MKVENSRRWTVQHDLTWTVKKLEAILCSLLTNYNMN